MIPGIISAPLFAAVQGMEAICSPTSAHKSAGSANGASIAITTPSVTVTASGGTPPYSHSWASSGGGSAAATASTSATTAFEATLAPGDTDSETFVDTVTDANGVETSARCPVFIQHVDLR